MDPSSISAILNTSQVSSVTNPFQQRRQDFQALAAALQSGDLAGAQKAFAAFQQDIQTIQNGRQQAGQGQPSGAQSGQGGQFANDIQALGNALSTGDINAAQSAFAALRQDIQTARQAHSGGHQSGNGLLQSIGQTLTQLGLNPTGQAGATGASGSADNDGDTDGSVSGTTQSQNTDQALAGFLHTLFQALRQNSQSSGSATDNDSSGGSASAVNSGYGGVTSNLQSLLQSLSSGSTPSNSLNDLSTSFQNLVQALGAANSSGAANSTTGNQQTLQAFLQTLIQNLNSNAGGLNAVGAITNTSA